MYKGEFLKSFDWEYALEQTDGYDYDFDLSMDIDYPDKYQGLFI